MKNFIIQMLNRFGLGKGAVISDNIMLIRKLSDYLGEDIKLEVIEDKNDTFIISVGNSFQICYYLEPTLNGCTYKVKDILILNEN